MNCREGWRGYLWQGRFASVAMDERHLMACARYVEMNPVRAGLVAAPQDWRWSSAAAHLDAPTARNDQRSSTSPVGRIQLWLLLKSSSKVRYLPAAEASVNGVQPDMARIATPSAAR